MVPMITTLTGSNHYMLQSELRRLVDGFVATHSDMGLERIDGEEAEYDRIREALESLPFLASRKLVVLRTPGAQKQFTERISSLLNNVPDTTDVLIVEPKLDKRSSYYKTLKSRTDFRTFDELDEIALAKWLTRAAGERGGTLQLAAAQLLIRRIGTNQQLLSSELTKLIHYHPEVTKDTIQLLSEPTPQSSVFDLLEAALNGRTKEALTLYDEQRLQKIEPIQIIALLGWQLHILAVIKSAGERDAVDIAREAKLNPYVVRKSMAVARRLTMSGLKELIHAVHELDVRMKRESIDADEVMRNLFLQISQ
jgi:DNA polymerase-3 subunit delta